MAKKIKAAAAPLITGEQAIKRFDGKNLQQIGKEAEALGTSGNQTSITALMCGLAFAAGRAAKAKKLAKYDFKSEYDTFTERFYRGRDMPSTSTSKVYLSNYTAFVEAGMKEWGEPIAVAALNTQGSAKVPVTLSWKAGQMRKLLEKDAAPSADELKAAFTRKVKTGGTKARNHAGRIVGLLNAVEAYADDGFIAAMPTFGTLKAGILRELFEAAYQMRVELEKVAKAGDDKKKAAKAAKDLAAKINKMPKPDRRMSA